jgi:tRNA(Met) C34 N-acetyltransferase TmcA
MSDEKPNERLLVNSHYQNQPHDLQSTLQSSYEDTFVERLLRILSKQQQNIK